MLCSFWIHDEVFFFFIHWSITGKAAINSQLLTKSVPKHWHWRLLTEKINKHGASPCQWVVTIEMITFLLFIFLVMSESGIVHCARWWRERFATGLWVNGVTLEFGAGKKIYIYASSAPNQKKTPQEDPHEKEDSGMYTRYLDGLLFRTRFSWLSKTKWILGPRCAITRNVVNALSL